MERNLLYSMGCGEANTSLSNIPHPAPSPVAVSAELGRITCARMIAYYDNENGIVICEPCHERNHAYITLRYPQCVRQTCHLFSNDIHAKGCKLCGAFLISGRPYTGYTRCPDGIGAYIQYLELTGRVIVDRPDFIINIGPDPIPMKLLNVDLLEESDF